MRDERQSAALSAVVAAAFLTTLEFMVGIVTRSLGILSGAAHSGLDLGAALTALYAVRTSPKPADEAHHYGHGKIESLAGLIETALLLGTCLWIIAEAIQRLVSQFALVEASFAGFAMMTISIVVDVSRAYPLYRVARKYGSQALEADALHFTSDALGSLVIIVGLVFVRLGYPVADAVAALGVVGLVAVASIRLGKRTTDVLLDRAPEGIARRLEEEVKMIRGVVDCHNVRVRRSGAETFVDMHISIDHSVAFDKAHEVASEAEEKVRSILPNSDIVVHMEPVSAWTENLVEEVRSTACEVPGVRGVHDMQVREIERRLYIDLHLEVEGTLRLREAHDVATLVEERIKSGIENIAEIATHIEPVRETLAYGEDVTETVPSVVRQARGIALQVPGVKDCHGIVVKNVGNRYHLDLSCVVDESLSLADAHEIANKVERAVLEKIRNLAHVLVHVEPVSTSIKQE